MEKLNTKEVNNCHLAIFFYKLYQHNCHLAICRKRPAAEDIAGPSQKKKKTPKKKKSPKKKKEMTPAKKKHKLLLLHVL
jgi:hypothetical protein